MNVVAYKPIVISSTAATARGIDVTPADAAAAVSEVGGIVGWAVDAYSGASALRHVWVSGNNAL